MPARILNPWTQSEIDELSEHLSAYFINECSDEMKYIQRSLIKKVWRDVFDYELSKKAFHNLVYRNRKNLLTKYKNWRYFIDDYKMDEVKALPTILLTGISEVLASEFQDDIECYKDSFEDLKPKLFNPKKNNK